MEDTPIVTAGYHSNITWVDYDNDGDLDLFATVGGSTGAGTGRLYRNEGNGVFTPITTGQLVELTSNSTGAAWGDYDNDGFSDVFVCRLDNSFGRTLASFLFHNNGDGTFTGVDHSPFTVDQGYAVSCSWGDWDNDGWLDLIVTNLGNGGRNRLYHNNGDGTFTRILSGNVATDYGSSTGAIWGDYDRDGFLDLFVANSTVGGGASKDFLYHNDGNTNAWITIKLVGTASNRSAIGAKVRVKATINGKTFWQLREINTGDGWSQNALEAHVGLGNATNVETLRIEWPSGTVQEMQNVPVKQLLKVTEPARIFVGKLSSVPQFTLHGGRNLQYDLQASSDLQAWSSFDTVTITNVDGKLTFTEPAASGSFRFYRAVLR